MTTAKRSNIFFPNLDGLRFIAFFLVFAQHAFRDQMMFLKIENPVLKFLYDGIFARGGVGVSVFFVLSGFLITYLILSEININGQVDVRSFYVRRALRIWPLYFAMVTYSVIIYPYLKARAGLPVASGPRPLYYFTFLSNFDALRLETTMPGHNPLSGGITWSVSIEEQFYLVWPLLFYLVPKRFFAAVFYCIIAIGLAFRMSHIDQGAVLYFHTLSVVSDLAIGGLAAYYSLNSMRFKSFFEKMTPQVRALVYLVGLLVAMAVENDVFGVHHPIVIPLAASLFYAFVILEQNFNLASRQKLSRLGMISGWGKYTYGLYLLHTVVLTLGLNAAKLLHREIDTVPKAILFGVVVFLGSLGVSYVSYHTFEKRFLKLKERFSYITRNVTISST